MKFTASWSWWRRFKRRFPTVVPRMKEAIKLERLRAENPEYIREWFNGYQTTILEKGITSPEQLVIIDEAGTFIGYGNRRKVVATKGKNAGRGEREEREWISVLAGGTAAGVQLPPCYLLRAGNIVGNLGEHGYAIRVPKAFNTHDGFRERKNRRNGNTRRKRKRGAQRRKNGSERRNGRQHNGGKRRNGWPPKGGKRRKGRPGQSGE